MYCTKCGNEIPDDAVFCTNCGQPVEVQSIAATQQAHAVVNTATPRAQTSQAATPQFSSDAQLIAAGAASRNRNNKRLGIIFAIAGILFAAAVIGVLEAVDLIPNPFGSKSSNTAIIAASTSSSPAESATASTSTAANAQAATGSTTVASTSASAATPSTTSASSTQASSNTLSQAEPSDSPIAYSDSTYGYSITIPAGFAQTSTSASGATFSDPDLDMTIDLSGEQNTSGKSIDDYAAEALGGHTADYEHIGKTEYVVSYYSADGVTEYYIAGFVDSQKTSKMVATYPSKNSDTCDRIVEELYASYDSAS